LTLLLVASTLFAGTFSGASAETHPGGDHGNFYPNPATYDLNQVVELVANFETDQKDKTVTFLRETPAGSNDYTSVGTAKANSNGNAYLKNYKVTGEQKFYARTSAAKVTEIHTLTPTVPGPVDAEGPVEGVLTPKPTAFAEGDTIELGANFPSGTFPVTFYKQAPDNSWIPLASIQSNSSGNAYFKSYKVVKGEKVFARKSNNDRTEILTITPAVTPQLSIQRDCSGNTCSGTATATGVLDPPAAGVSVRLQWKDGSSWKSVGSAANTDADGKVAIKFSLSGLSQWKTRTYRLLSNGLGSNQIQFMPGPTKLGKNVLRVDVDGGAYPVTKGPEYTGKATLSVDGVKTLDRVELENFGIRGTSTAAYTKKPYKLKFLTKPDVDSKPIFGMPSAKSWSLLAGWKDQAFVREKVALDLGRKATNIAWTPDSRYVEMFVNDQYRGSYILTESVKIDKERVNVDAKKGMIMEVDGYSVEDSQLGFKSATGKIVFAFKDPDERKVKNGAPDPEGVTDAKMQAIKDRIEAFESVIYNDATRSQYADHIDVPSAVDYWLVKEFTKDHDSDFSRSHYFSWDPSDPTNASSKSLIDDDKFHFGPAWDADHSAGNDTDNDAIGAYLRSPNGWMMRGTGEANGHSTYKTHWYVQLFKEQSFKDAVAARWDEIKTEFQKVSTVEVPANRAAVGVGATNDRSRWASEPKRFKPHTFSGKTGLDAEVAFVQDWYKKRYTWMNSQLD
jgi:hypothetical protein